MPYLSTKQKEEEVAARTARLAQVKSVLESMWNGVTTCLGVAVSPDLVCELLKRVWLARAANTMVSRYLASLTRVRTLS